jgi:HEAT repeat protein
MPEVEERTLVDWKAALYATVVRRLADREPQARVAAVACLGNLHDDRAAALAISYLEDRSEGAGPVRKQVLVSFAQRPILLTDDAILKRLHDPEPGVPETAELILTTRGLTREQIDLGRMIFDPKPEYRASVIPRLRNRADIDPVIWLLQLSHDDSEAVRAGAVAALAEWPSPEVYQRLTEMARTDPSSAVRQAAGKLVPPGPTTQTATTPPLPLPGPRRSGGTGNVAAKSEATVGLPPLPGSPSLNPKAN